MIGRRSSIALCMLQCALAVSAIAAANAWAAPGGTTGFTCISVAQGAETTKGFKDEHCKEPVGNGTSGGTQVKFEHLAWAGEGNTELQATNEKTPGQGSEVFTLKSTIGGMDLIIDATGVELVNTPTMMNHLEGEEHEATGTAKIKLTGITVTSPLNCTIAEPVTTTQLVANTGFHGMAVKFEPAAGTLIAEFTLEGAKCPEPFKGLKKVVGSILSTSIEGATVKFTHENTTEQGTLRIGSAAGPRAGINGLVTFKSRANNTEVYKPLAATTTGEG